MDDPLVTINILSYNREDELRNTLAKVYEQDYKNIEVIVVDNASGDNVREMIKTEFPGVNLIELDQNIGIAGWNEGAKHAVGEYILFLDDDAFITGDSLTEMVHTCVNNKIDILYPRTINPVTGISFNDVYSLGLLSFWGCLVLIKRTVFEELHGFDQTIFIWAHELEFTIRAIENDYTIGYLPEVVTYHTASINMRDYDPKKAIINARHFIYIATKYFSWTRLIVIYMNLLTRYIINCMKHSSTLLIPAQFISFIKKGIRNRKCVSKPVQILYHKNFHEFRNPLLMKYYFGKRNNFTLTKSRYYPESFSYFNKSMI